MPRLRTVVCTITMTGTPEWVEATLAKSWVLPDRGKAMAGIGKVSAVPVSDTTTEASAEDYEVAVGMKARTE